jgi:hypothetical protein
MLRKGTGTEMRSQVVQTEPENSVRSEQRPGTGRQSEQKSEELEWQEQPPKQED